VDSRNIFDIKGRVALVTAGAVGIGKMISRGLAEAGAKVVIAQRRYELCDALCAEYREKYGVEALPLKLDVTKEREIVDCVERVMARFGRIDILVNNVGESIIKDTFSTTLEEWNSIITLNLTSMFLLCREVGKHMKKQESGKIINIASVLGMRASWREYGTPGKTGELLSYASSKAAVVNFSRDLAANWARYNITVNSISPGWFVTPVTEGLVDDEVKNLLIPRIPMKRPGVEDDMKGVALFLASEASRYVTGHNLVVDGGWSCWM
jgi:NAD(P)-dependent dehydrogenase (short-subunit alcohol dehydrogenase family)